MLMEVLANSSLMSTVGGEDDASCRDEVGGHVGYSSHTLGADSEAHGSETRNCNGVALGGPRLDDFSGSVPTSLHHASADTAAKGSFLDDLGC